MADITHIIPAMASLATATAASLITAVTADSERISDANKNASEQSRSEALAFCRVLLLIDYSPSRKCFEEEKRGHH
jgi:hypothetical protein